MTSPDAARSLPNARNITRETLANGVTVLVYENHHTQSVVLSGSLHAGSIYEAPGRGGLAALTSSALMRGTAGRDFAALHSQLEDIGADLGYSYGPHKVGFSGKALAEDLPVLIDLLADTLRNPVFPADGVERLRGERLTLLGYRQQDTRWQAGRAFRENLYPAEHPYHHSSSGTLESLLVNEGPAVIEYPHTTVVVRPDQTARIDPIGSVVIDLSAMAIGTVKTAQQKVAS